MGCDIHLRVEYLATPETLSIDDQGKVVVVPDAAMEWIPAERVTQNDWWSEGDPSEQRMTVAYDDLFYTGRNYDLFGKLANVRTRGNITPIDDPRGLPPNVSAEVGYDLSEDDADLHSHSWFTLYELMAADTSDMEENWGHSRFDMTIDLMKTVADTKCGGNPYRVRIVFAFDN